MDVLFLVDAFQKLAALRAGPGIGITFTLALPFAQDQLALSFFLLQLVALQRHDLAFERFKGVFVLAAEALHEIGQIVQLGYVVR